ncbi:hypothetical protein DPMN_034304 [Dreissena polymorpha]|uniref:Uncharacterized protein n=1 Tax=Dreissena polymorpha TaxID=45954 RepID=A0A9D4RLY8_DREPO|nr:hypothetical protein DPMN_034304 [Dreissena polymorpha]
MPLCIDCRLTVQSSARVSQVSDTMSQAFKSLLTASLYLKAGRYYVLWDSYIVLYAHVSKSAEATLSKKGEHDLKPSTYVLECLSVVLSLDIQNALQAPHVTGVDAAYMSRAVRRRPPRGYSPDEGYVADILVHGVCLFRLTVRPKYVHA